MGEFEDRIKKDEFVISLRAGVLILFCAGIMFALAMGIEKQGRRMGAIEAKYQNLVKAIDSLTPKPIPESKKWGKK